MEKVKICKECKEEIPADAKKCKHCGSDQRNFFERHVIFTFLLIFVGFIIVINSCSKNTTSPTQTIVTKQPEKQEEVIQISASELFRQYEANEIKADENFKNKLLEVSGEVGNIGKDILDSMYVTLSTDNSFSEIQCMLKNSEKSKIAQMNKGDSIVVQGRGGGKMMNVFLSDCIIK